MSYALNLSAPTPPILDLQKIKLIGEDTDEWFAVAYCADLIDLINRHLRNFITIIGIGIDNGRPVVEFNVAQFDQPFRILEFPRRERNKSLFRTNFDFGRLGTPHVVCVPLTGDYYMLKIIEE